MSALAAGSGMSSFTAGPGANGILVVIALVLFLCAAITAAVIPAHRVSAVLGWAGLAVFMLALLAGS